MAALFFLGMLAAVPIGLAGGIVVSQWIEDDTDCVICRLRCDADPTRALDRFFR